MTLDWRVSACTKSMSSLAETGSATSQPKSDGTRGARRRATSAPSGLETPVMRTREGKGGVTPTYSHGGAEARIHSGRHQAAATAPSALVASVRGVPRGDPDSPALL